MRKDKLAKYGKRALYILLANLCSALALNMFLSGNHIAAGGFSGLAIVLNHFFPIPIGAFVLALSVPLFIWGVFAKGWPFVLNTLAATVLYSVVVDSLALVLPCVTDNLALAAVCGGALHGLSAVLFLQADSSSGGTDLLARLLLTRRRDLSLGTMFLFVDGAVVLFSVIVTRNFELGICAAISLGVSSYVNDLLIRGMNRASIFFIIPSGPPEPIADAVIENLSRGVTLLKGEGMYAHGPRSLLLTVVKPNQGYKVKGIVKAADPNAFVFTAPANEVVGKGFLDVDASAGKER